MKPLTSSHREQEQGLSADSKSVKEKANKSQKAPACEQIATPRLIHSLGLEPDRFPMDFRFISAHRYILLMADLSLE